MKLSIGNRIRTLRSQRGITQDEPTICNFSGYADGIDQTIARLESL